MSIEHNSAEHLSSCISKENDSADHRAAIGRALSKYFRVRSQLAALSGGVKMLRAVIELYRCLAKLLFLLMLRSHIGRVLGRVVKIAQSVNLAAASMLYRAPAKFTDCVI